MGIKTKAKSLIASFWLDMPSLYTFHESNFSRVQRTKIELSKNKLPKYRLFNCLCETFCTYKVMKYNAQSLVPDITKHFPLVPENHPIFIHLWSRRLCAQSMHSQAHKCTVRYTNAQSGTQMHSQVHRCTVRYTDAQHL